LHADAVLLATLVSRMKRGTWEDDGPPDYEELIVFRMASRGVEAKKISTVDCRVSCDGLAWRQRRVWAQSCDASAYR
jgi:hypothetical protein